MGILFKLFLIALSVLKMAFLSYSNHTIENDTPCDKQVKCNSKATTTDTLFVKTTKASFYKMPEGVLPF